MSALAWDEAALTGSPTCMPRRHLSLVPAPSAAAGSGSGLRMTRRGRLALTLLALALITVAVFAGVRQANAAPGEVAPLATVTVAAGETLSEIAARELPMLPIADGVAKIQIANNLNSPAISAGATLTIPAP